MTKHQKKANGLQESQCEASEDSIESAEAIYEEDYANQRGYLADYRSKHSASFCSHLLAISASSLVFSTAFIDKIIPLSLVSFKIFLFISWMSFLISTLANVFSFKYAADSANDSFEKLEEAYEASLDLQALKPSKWETYLFFSNKIGLYLFLFGVISLVLFVCLNLDKIGNSPQPVKYILVTGTIL